MTCSPLPKAASIVLACFVVLGPQRIHATPLFDSGREFATGGAPRFVAIGDLNADGAPDLAVANSNSNTVSVLFGNGDGTFAPKTDFATGSTPSAVAIGDLNVDGRPDLVVANTSSNTVSILFGLGSGTFTPKFDIAVGGPRSLGVGDLNGDVWPDIAVVNGSGVSVLFGQGGRADFATGSGPLTVAIADLNGDGHQDLAVANGDVSCYSTVSVLLGSGDGTFAPRVDYPAGLGRGSCALGDLNADGHADLAFASWCFFEGNFDAELNVRLGNGDGTFGPFISRALDFAPTAIAIHDLDGDGRTDLAITGRPNMVSVLPGNGDGTFTSEFDFGTGGSSFVVIGDLNRDGLPDLVTANEGANSVTVLLNRAQTVPLAVNDFEATSAGTRAQLTWKLSSAAQRELQGVAVERAESVAGGPWVGRTAAALAPAANMSFVDPDVEVGRQYWYRLVLLQYDGSRTLAGPVALLAGTVLRTALHQPIQRWKHGPVVLAYSIATARTLVLLAVYDIRGREVWRFTTEVAVPGEHTALWQPRDRGGARLASGVYIVRLAACGVTASRKLALVLP
jgi:hypothetical protein